MYGKPGHCCAAVLIQLWDRGKATSRIVEITGMAGLRRRRAPRNDGLVEATSRIVEITGVPDRSLNFNKIIGLNGNYPTSVIARSKHLPKR